MFFLGTIPHYQCYNGCLRRYSRFCKELIPTICEGTQRVYVCTMQMGLNPSSHLNEDNSLSSSGTPLGDRWPSFQTLTLSLFVTLTGNQQKIEVVGIYGLEGVIGNPNTMTSLPACPRSEIIMPQITLLAFI